jgi:hypothetical protein
MDQPQQNSPIVVSDDELLEDIPFESDLEKDEALMPKYTPVEQRNIRQYLLSNFLILIIGLPIVILPIIVLSLLGRININDIRDKFGSGPNYHTEVARLDLFLAMCSVSFWIINILSFVIPTALPRNRGKCFIQVRGYFNVSLGILAILIWGAFHLYKSTLFTDINQISEYVKTGSKGAKTTFLSPAGEISLKLGVFYLFERLAAAALVVVAFLGTERYLIEKLKLSFHRISFFSRITELNETYSLLARAFKRLSDSHPTSFFTMPEEKRKEFSLLRKEFLSVDEAIEGRKPEDLAKEMFKDKTWTLEELDFSLGIDSEARNLFKWVSEPIDDKDPADRTVIDADLLKIKIARLFDQRKYTRAQLIENNRIIKRLHSITRIVFLLLGGALAAPFFDFGVGKFWATYLFVAGSFGFLFKSSFRTTFEAMILIFARHPFDVGDVVLIDDLKLNVIIMQVFTTRFTRVDNGNEVYIPNSRIIDKNIVNLSRQNKT